MRRIRVIPTLLLDSDGGLVKTERFGKRTYIGDPINAVKIFNDKGADELLLMDIDCTRDRREPNYPAIEDIVSEAFMPVAYGGGVRTVDQMAALFRCGLEKVVVSTAAYECPELIRQATERFGAQSVVACMDVRKDFFGRTRVYVRNGTSSTKTTPKEFAQRVAQHGAGEIIVYSINRDGCYSGYDLQLLKQISAAVRVPVVACGGARSIDDFLLAASEADCAAVAAGSMFLFQSHSRGILISYPSEGELQSRLFDEL